MSIGVATAALATAAKGPSVKVGRHQARQRASVRRSSPGTTDRRARRDGVVAEHQCRDQRQHGGEVDVTTEKA